MRNLLIVCVLLNLCFTTASCRPGDSDEAQALSMLTPGPTSNAIILNGDDQVVYSADGLTLSLNKPPEWESFPTDYGIVIGERFGSVATAGVLEGLMTYVFVTPLADFRIDAGLEVNIAEIALNDLLADPVYTSNIAHTPAVGFRWDGLDAAYYLISGEDDSATMVIGVAVPDQRVLLSCSISAPYDQRHRIREALPDLLDGVKFNQRVFTGEALADLPTPLDFPQYRRPMNEGS